MFEYYFKYDFQDGVEDGIEVGFGSFLLFEAEEQEDLHVGGKVFPFDTK